MTFVDQLKILSDRLTAAPQLDKSGTWIGGKMTKPSLDSIGNWLEGRFTKFIAGDADSPRPEESKSMAQQQSYSGPFANFSSISSATTSAYPSPHQSVTDLTEVPPSAPPFRTGSAMGGRPPSRTQYQINRASSAMDHVRPFQRGASPIARVASANAASLADGALPGQARGPYGNGYAPAPSHLRPDSNSHGDVSGQGHSKPPSTGSWWGASEMDASTPTATSFVSLDEQPSSSTSNSGFISLMDSVDSPMLSATPTGSRHHTASAPPPTHRNELAFDDEDDDLGLGNTSSRKKAATENGEAADQAGSKEEDQPKPTAVDKAGASDNLIPPGIRSFAYETFCVHRSQAGRVGRLAEPYLGR